MDRDSLCDSLIAWIKSFNLIKSDVQIDFRDGILIARCLNNIDPQYFNDEWLNKFKYDANDNWRLKLLNLKKILEALQDYYSEILNHPLNGFQMPNLNLYLELNDQEELSRLLQLILGCAVNCERKSEYIKNIMEMPVDAQHMIMTAIQEVMSKERFKSSCDEDLNYQLKKTLLELNRVNEQKEEIEQKCRSLDCQLSILQDEKSALMSEIEMFKEKLLREDSTRDDINKQKKLQQKIDLMQEELYKLDAIKEEYRIKCEAIKIENELLIEKNTELKKIAQDTQLIKDELDILKHNTDKVDKLESTIETYKIKLEAMSDFKVQMKLLEESNTKYMERIIQMEEDAKKITSLKAQIDIYKKQMQELHESLLTNEMKVKKYEYEHKRYEERLNSIQQEKERLSNELYLLKKENIESEIIDEFNRNSIQNTLKIIDDDKNYESKNANDLAQLELLSLPPELKEKIIRLYHENKVLKSKQTQINDDNLLILQNQYEDEKERNNELQIKMNTLQAQIIELESQISDLKDEQINKESTHQNPNNTQLNDIIEFKNKLNTKNTKLEEECKKHMIVIQNLEATIDGLKKEKFEMKEVVSIKEKEISETREKFNIYMEKAKFIIKTLDPSNTNQATNNEIQTLKNEIIEKDKKIKELTRDIEKSKTSYEKEEQLILSAWNRLATNLNRSTTDERIESIGNSFLSQQRHLFKRSTNLNSTHLKNGNVLNGGNY